jgi:hypothetical protein
MHTLHQYTISHLLLFEYWEVERGERERVSFELDPNWEKITFTILKNYIYIYIILL